MGKLTKELRERLDKLSTTNVSDALDALGLEMPQTVDEYYETLVAFRDKDPNGNGEQDEIPLAPETPLPI